MTIETKTTIQLSDIKAIEFECKNCHRIALSPIAVATTPPYYCECHVPPEWMPQGGDMYQRIKNLIGLVQQLAQANNEPFAIRLVVDGISDRASTAKY